MGDRIGDFVAAVPDDYMSTPVPYIGSELVHPDVLHVPSGWSGYEYWMAVTPYPGSDSRFENPSIYASHDGETWVTPAGASNPITRPRAAASGSVSRR